MNEHIATLNKIIDDLQKENEELKIKQEKSEEVIRQLQESNHYKEFCRVKDTLEKMKKQVESPKENKYSAYESHFTDY